jgi:hypothetical protein
LTVKVVSNTWSESRGFSSIEMTVNGEPASEGACWTCYSSDGHVFGHILPVADGFRFVRREEPKPRNTAAMSYEEFQKYSGDLIAEHQRRKL